MSMSCMASLTSLGLQDSFWNNTSVCLSIAPCVVCCASVFVIHCSEYEEIS